MAQKISDDAETFVLKITNQDENGYVDSVDVGIKWNIDSVMRNNDAGIYDPAEWTIVVAVSDQFGLVNSDNIFAVSADNLQEVVKITKFGKYLIYAWLICRSFEYIERGRLFDRLTRQDAYTVCDVDRIIFAQHNYVYRAQNSVGVPFYLPQKVTEKRMWKLALFSTISIVFVGAIKQVFF